MKKLLYMILMLTMLICTAGLYSQIANHVDLLSTLNGEFSGSEFGNSVVSMDFNGDGYDDLIVSSQAWNPEHLYETDQQRYGKLYFYWGGPNFDTIPDMVIEGSYDDDYGSEYGGTEMYNAGDMNGDGIDDLIICGRAQNQDIELRLFFGRTTPLITPDITIAYPTGLYDSMVLFPLGDINGDGRADVSIKFTYHFTRYIGYKTFIWDDVTTQPYLFYQPANRNITPYLCGIGDINADGFDDCFMDTAPNATSDLHHIRPVLYYGGETFPADSLVITEDSNTTFTRVGSALGDINGDGYGDFSAFNWKFWLGGENIDINNYLTFTSNETMEELIDGYPLIHKDLNHDGYDDMLGSVPHFGTIAGEVILYMGRATPNGTPDLYIHPPFGSPYWVFGWSKAIGDFNGDGVWEIAISGSGVGGVPVLGRVFIYAANDALHDTTVSNEDDTLPLSLVNPWNFTAYPNPVNKSNTSINLKFIGSAYDKERNVEVDITNIKGEKVLNKVISSASLHAREWDTGKLNVASGVYIIKIKAGSKTVAARKIVIQ